MIAWPKDAVHRWHPQRPGWIVIIGERVYDANTGHWIYTPPVRWDRQEIGVGVRRCPTPHEVASQPERRLRRVRGRSVPTERDWYVIERHQIDGASYAQIGRELGVSRERVRQLLAHMRMGYEWTPGTRARAPLSPHAEPLRAIPAAPP